MESQQSGDSLGEALRRQIEAGGPMTVARYMQQALYHPHLGYYSRGPNIGPRGDFTTSPEASPAFARLLARHVADIDGLLGRPSPFHIVECGPGLGTLPHGLLGTLASSHQDLYGRLRYYLVEISPALVARQRERLLPHHESVAEWKGSMEELPTGSRGALLANEFVDALPVHVLENRDGRVVEQYVTTGRHGLSLAYAAPSRSELTEFLDRYDIRLEPGQRIEVNLAANDWIAQVALAFDQCVATIIDYGDTSPSRYSAQRREGTQLGYYAGKVTHDILAHPGEQDLTALVDFTALQDQAFQHGLDVLGLTRQANFLVGLGLGTAEVGEERQLSGDLARAIAYRRGIQALVSMEGLGQFHVLLLGKRVNQQAAAQHLSGLQYAHLF